MKNSHRKVAFEMSENQEMSKNRCFHNEIDILLYQNGAEKINKTIENIISLILCHVLIKNNSKK